MIGDASRGGPGASALLDRRAWLTAAFAGWLACSSRGDEPKDEQQPKPPVPDPEVKSLEDLALQQGLGRLGASKTPEYLAIGDATADFRLRVLRTCVSLQREFLDHFQRRGFAVQPPPSRLTIVTLANLDSYSRILGPQVAETECGCYSPRTNRVFLLDRRIDPGEGPQAHNLSDISHEATHQLVYNIGLMKPFRDAPRAITEGLAMYAELRTPSGQGAIGELNFVRLDDLWLGIRRGVAWLSLARLLEEDDLFDSRISEDSALQSHAQSWVLVHYLMTNPVMLPRFRAYLECQRFRGPARFRLVDAELHLGKLAPLGLEVQRHARALGRRRT